MGLIPVGVRVSPLAQITKYSCKEGDENLFVLRVCEESCGAEAE